MKKFTVIVISFVMAFSVGACAELKHAGKEIGHATKEVTTSIGHASRDAAKDVKKSVE